MHHFHAILVVYYIKFEAKVSYFMHWTIRLLANGARTLKTFTITRPVDSKEK